MSLPPLVRAVFVLVAILTLSRDDAAAESGVRRTPRDGWPLVSKDIAGERWAITRFPAGYVAGNVFFPSGRAPAFVWCEPLESSDLDAAYRCFGADACVAHDCSLTEWEFLTTTTLRDDFFEPSRAQGVAGVTIDNLGVAQQGSGQKGHRRTPDGRTLINRRVGNEQWAITYTPFRQVVTGNVFSGADSPPQFVWCSEVQVGPRNATMNCRGAGACSAASCTEADWTDLGRVTVPRTVLIPAPQPVQSAEYRGSVFFSGFEQDDNCQWVLRGQGTVTFEIDRTGGSTVATSQWKYVEEEPSGVSWNPQWQCFSGRWERQLFLPLTVSGERIWGSVETFNGDGEISFNGIVTDQQLSGTIFLERRRGSVVQASGPVSATRVR